MVTGQADSVVSVMCNMQVGKRPVTEALSQRRGTQAMELRTPPPLSDDEIYRFAENATPAALSNPPAHEQTNVDGDITSMPTASEPTPRTMISDPVIVTLTGSGTAASGSDALPPTEQTVTQIAADNGKSRPSTVAEKQPIPAPTTRVDASRYQSEQAECQFRILGPQVNRLRTRRRKRVRLRYLMQAWGVSLVVHVVILSALAAATFSSQDTIKRIVNFDSALASNSNGEPEVLPIYADPDNTPRDKAIGDEHAATAGESRTGRAQ